MFYALCHAVDSFVGMGKNAPKKSPAGVAGQCFAARLCRPLRFGRYAPSSLRPAQPRKTNRKRIYRTDVALTEQPVGDNKKAFAYANGKHLDLFRYLAGEAEIVIFGSHQIIKGKQ
ncbi:MAG: hypothetical protein IPP03_21165 [Dechloromonas sp.]|nr:hypothetical protein [Candidatus Dechloromonas phosphoritropha]